MSKSQDTKAEQAKVKDDKKDDKKVDAKVEEAAAEPEEEIDAEGKEAPAEEHILAQQVPMAFNVITAPLVCPPGYRLDSTRKCRRIM